MNQNFYNNYNSKIKFILSPTALNLFMDCPRCFWLERVLDRRRPQGPFPSLPSGIDEVLKKYFDQYRAKGELPPILDGHLTGQLAQQTEIDQWRKGVGFDIPEKQGRFWGKLDEALRLPTGEIAPVDYKTRGYPPRAEIIAPYQNQLDCYGLLLKEAGQPVASTGYLVYYYPQRNSGAELHSAIPFEVELKPVTIDPERARKLLHQALDFLQGQSPLPHPTCQFCQWQNLESRI
jgi:CRISPR/Cas system-associated exonuclease Cas4 (RecB family)